MAFVTLYRIEHPRKVAAWCVEWNDWADERNEDWWTEYSDYDEAMDQADIVGGVVVEFKRISTLRDVYARTLGPTRIAAE